jgi:hypothetical protein
MKLTRTAMLAVAVSLMAMPGCATRASQPLSDPSRWQGDPRLYNILNVYPLADAQRDSLRLYTIEHADYVDELLAHVVEDRYAPAEARVNALLILSERTATLQLPVFRAALDDDDPRVRAMAVSSMRRFVETRPEDALQLARMALQDSHADVQAQALHVLADREPALLRSYLADAATPELRSIADDLIRVAEERGAPLAGDEVTGTLARETSHGFAVRFTPRRHWPQWNAALGDVTVTAGAGAPFTLPEIEAVAGVVPVFFAPDGDYLVYERNREIVVRSVTTGAERVVGQGMAPRALPFTNHFVFLREVEDARAELRQGTRMHYEVLRGSFAVETPAEPELLGTLTGLAAFAVHGAYSTVRWMRVEDRGGLFYLDGDNVETYALPDPFGA